MVAVLREPSEVAVHDRSRAPAGALDRRAYEPGDGRSDAVGPDHDVRLDAGGASVRAGEHGARDPAARVADEVDSGNAVNDFAPAAAAARTSSGSRTVRRGAYRASIPSRGLMGIGMSSSP